jgi:glycosyltransferase involved in cell wall biosynthesis
MLFSVVIPVYNRHQLIKKSIDSALDQLFEDYEVIVVDDGSTDGTVSVLESYDGRIRLLQQRNRGPGAARNRGIEAARGEYVAFLDSDDQWFPWTLSVYSRAIEKCGKPTLLSSSVVYFQGEAPTTRRKEEDSNSLKVSAYSDFLEAAGKGRYVSTGRVVVEKTALEASGGFTSENINAEDHDFAFRVGEYPGYVHVESPALVAVRRHDERVTQNQEKTWAGLDYLIRQERAGAYPGGEERRRDRRYLLCQHIRSASVELVKAGYIASAFDLYRRSLLWQLKFGRCKYILGFPLLAGWLLLADVGGGVADGFENR